MAEKIRNYILALALYVHLKSAKNNTFICKGTEYDYFFHQYNFAWRNERAVEVPIILKIINDYKGSRILEVGNVLSHYFKTNWPVVDKYEKFSGVINEDVVSYLPANKFDLIISISTLEHVGWDEEPKDVKKIFKALDNLVNNCLNEGGMLVFTIPLGYNPVLDNYIFSKEIKTNEVYYLKRKNWKNEWKEVNIEEAKTIKYGSQYNDANGLIIAHVFK